MKVLGVNLFGHDHAVFIIDTTKQKVFAISLERVNRIKHDNNTLDLIVSEYPKEFEDIDYICLGGGTKESQFTINIGKKFTNILKKRKLFYDAFKPKYLKDQIAIINNKETKNPFRFGFINFFNYTLLSIESRFLKDNDFNQDVFSDYIKKMFPITKNKNITYYDHHHCHAASSYYFSGFKKDRVISLTLDGYGDDYFSKVYFCENNQMKYIGGSKVKLIENATIGENILSIGTLYGNFTQAMGLRRNSEEGKVEALAAYGNFNNDIYIDLLSTYQIENVQIQFNQKIEKYYDALYLKSLREKHGDENFCAAIQAFLNHIVIDYLNDIKKEFKSNKLCLGGGVTANVITNLAIFEKGLFDDIFVFPAMADDGVAAGAALLKLIEHNEDLSFLENEIMPYWGPDINYNNDLKLTLEKNKDYISYEYNPNWQPIIAKKLYDNEVGALVLEKMEFGPRALGNRSIVASPLNNETRDKINSNIKKRPAYQPFCPSVLEEERLRLFEESLPNKHMTFAFRLKADFKEKLPSAVHVDLTGRPQFVEEKDNPKYYKLIKEFKKISGYGIIIDTSFNLHGRTIVRTPQDAIDDFIDCNLDFLVIDDFVITRNKI